jgi:hypothetical protein
MRAPPSISNPLRHSGESYAMPEPRGSGQQEDGDLLNTVAGPGLDPPHALPGTSGRYQRESSRSSSALQNKRKANKAPRRPSREAEVVPVLGPEAPAQPPPVTPPSARRQAWQQQQGPRSSPTDVGSIQVEDGPMLAPSSRLTKQPAPPPGGATQQQHNNQRPGNKSRPWLWVVPVLLVLTGVGVGLGVGVGECAAL